MKKMQILATAVMISATTFLFPFSQTLAAPYNKTSLSCSINVACDPTWAKEAQAVVRNGVVGTFLNNTAQDGKLYFLTAYHFGYPSIGQTVNWDFRFNNQSDTCADPAEQPVHEWIYGPASAIVRAADFSMDFTLVELLKPLPDGHNLALAGWDRTGTQPTSGVSFGHPKGDIKKIVYEDDPVPNYSPYIWLPTFDRGSLEMGDSGAPLFDQNHRLVGHLSSAYSINLNACSGPGGDDNAATIIMAKFKEIWNIGTPGNRVSDYLDPINSGATTMNTIYLSEIEEAG